MYQVIESGTCVCVCEPRGDKGLEGYQLNDKYPYQLMYDTVKDVRYYRVYPVPEGKHSEYYETCGIKVFARYFEKEENNG